jgi:hypothetical protein
MRTPVGIIRKAALWNLCRYRHNSHWFALRTEGGKTEDGPHSGSAERWDMDSEVGSEARLATRQSMPKSCLASCRRLMALLSQTRLSSSTSVGTGGFWSRPARGIHRWRGHAGAGRCRKL